MPKIEGELRRRDGAASFVLLYLDKAIVSDSVFVLHMSALARHIFVGLPFASTAHHVLTRCCRSAGGEISSNVFRVQVT